MLYDKDIREPLFDYLEERYGKIRIIEEKQMGRSRADAVMVRPFSLSGIEIKSDADTYARLKRQVRDYDRYFDYNYVETMWKSMSLRGGELSPLSRRKTTLISMFSGRQSPIPAAFFGLS